MRFFTIFTVLTAGAMAFAGVVPEIVEKRSTKDVQNAFTDLGHKFDAIIPKFDNCWDSQCSDAIVVELASAIDGFTATIGGLPGGLGSIPLATTIKDIITKLTVGLDTHKTKCGDKCPGLVDIYAKVDLSLSASLKAAFHLCFGLVVLVTFQLLNMVAILKGLGLASVLKVCLL